MTLRLLCLLFLMPSPGAATCVTAQDLATGIACTRQDGRSGSAVAAGGLIEIDYAVTPDTAWQDFRRTSLGIYEMSWAFSPTDLPIVGGGPGGSYTYRFAGTPPVPTPGTAWTTTVRRVASRDIGVQSGPVVTRHRYKVTYRLLDIAQATVSGCTYTILPVEAVREGGGAQRWIYFPDLGFGIETSRSDGTEAARKLGLTALQPQG